MGVKGLRSLQKSRAVSRESCGIDHVCCMWI